MSAPVGARLDILAAHVRERTDLVPRAGMVLGSGLGSLADEIVDATVIPFAEMPGWPPPSAPGHAGRLLLGMLRGVPVACLQGRLHMYEGLEARLVAEPALLMGRLGADVLVLTNASGGIDRELTSGSLMLIVDHINLTGRHPLIGPNDDALGPRFPDMTRVWDAELSDRLRAAARGVDVDLRAGIYLGLLGPSYETPAEVRMIGMLGADAVGMSTVMEAISAHWSGMRVCGVSLVTNAAAGMSPTPLSHDEVLGAADVAGPRLARVIGRFLEDL